MNLQRSSASTSICLSFVKFKELWSIKIYKFWIQAGNLLALRLQFMILIHEFSCRQRSSSEIHSNQFTHQNQYLVRINHEIHRYSRNLNKKIKNLWKALENSYNSNCNFSKHKKAMNFRYVLPYTKWLRLCLVQIHKQVVGNSFLTHRILNFVCRILNASEYVEQIT